MRGKNKRTARWRCERLLFVEWNGGGGRGESRSRGQGVGGRGRRDEVMGGRRG